MSTLLGALHLNDSEALTPTQLASVEHVARSRITEWWVRANLEPHYPTDDETAVKLVQAVDYIIDLESLVRFCDVAAFTGVAISDGMRQWGARDIARLGLFLECRRSWRPGSLLHETKKTAAQIAFEALGRADEQHELFADLECFDLRALLLMLTESESRMQREILFVAVQIKLASYDLSI